MKKELLVECPKCKTEKAWDENNLFRPFCSKRCKMIDFGDWANENNVISSELMDDKGDFLQIDSDDNKIH